MFAFNETKHERIENGEYEIKYLTVNSEETVGSSISMYEFIQYAFNVPSKVMEDFPVEEFLQEYEFLYDEIREQVLLIIRDARIRIRKYHYLPPIYVAFPMRNGISMNWEPQMSRYYLKFQPHGWLMQQSKEEAYNLCDHPFQMLYHPHIDASGSACYGRWCENINDAEGPYQKIESIRAFLNDYNGRSTFFTLEAHAFDRKDNHNAYHFPYETTTVIQVSLPRYYQSWANMLENKLGENWLVDLCEDMGLNYVGMQFTHQWYLYSDNNNSSQGDWDRAFDAFVSEGNFPGLDGPHFFPGNDEEKYTEDEWQKRYDLYQSYSKEKGLYNYYGFSKQVGYWLQKKIGYEFSNGDLFSLRSGVRNWVSANMRDDLRYSDMFMSWSGSEPNGFRMSSILETMGIRSRDQSGPDMRGTSLLYMISCNSNLNQLMLKTFEWEFYARKSLPTDALESSYRNARRASQHNYDKLIASGMMINSMTFESGYLKDGMFSYEYKNTLFLNHHLGVMLRKCARTFKNALGRRSYASAEYQKILLDTLCHTSPEGMEKVSFEKRFSNSKVDEKEVWYDMMKRLFKDYIVCESSGNNNWFWGYIWKLNDEIKEDTESIERSFNGSIYNLPPDDQEFYQEEAVRIWYLFFPMFPNSIEEMEELRFQLDKEILTKSLLHFTDVLKKKDKEYKDVLKNTLPSMEQGELFSQEVPVN